jgi:hypothetical protein
LGASFFSGRAAPDYNQVEIFDTRQANLPLHAAMRNHGILAPRWPSWAKSAESQRV